MIKKILNLINEKNNILLSSHTSPDGDSVGSLAALGLSIESMGKKATLYNESLIPAVYRFLPSMDRIVSSFNNPAFFDAAIILDCSDIERVGDAASLILKIPEIINIDHHITNTKFGTARLIDAKACSTAEIVYRLIKKMGVAITKAIATSIYTGILTDTGSFRFSNTNKKAFLICKEMVECGVDPSYVAQNVYGPFSPGRLKLLNLALDSLEISENGKISIMTLTQEMFEEIGTQPEDTDGFLNYGRNIKDIQVAAMIQQKEDSGLKGGPRGAYHVSLRSDGSADVAAIASGFGGGGHKSAAGFGTCMTIKEIKENIFKLAKTL